MPAIQPAYISTGEAAIKIVSETLGGCYGLGCLANAGYGYEKNMRAEYCSIRTAPLFYESMTPGFRLDVSAKELSAVNYQLLGGSADALVTGASVTALLKIGNPSASSSVADPAEWHIVRLTGAAPWAFTLYTEHKDMSPIGGTFVKASNIEVYTAAKTNGDTDVPAIAWAYDSGVVGKFKVDDPCAGKVTFTAIPDADVVQWTWNPSDPPFLINGVAPHKPDDLRMGDVVALVGIAYSWGWMEDAAGVEVPAANRTIVQFPNAVEKPLFIKLVHRNSQNPDYMATIVRMWRMYNTTGFNQNLNPMTTSAHTLDASFRAADASDISPDSPTHHIEVIESSTVLSWASLLQLAATG